MSITITQLRADIYNIVDNVIKTGQPIEIERAGKRLRIVPMEDEGSKKVSKFDRLISRREAISGDPADYTHLDWSNEWNP